MDDTSPEPRDSPGLYSWLRGKLESLEFVPRSSDGSEGGSSGRRSPAAISRDAGTLNGGHFRAAQFHQETGLTTEEYVLRYLETNGSRVSQQTLAESLTWSEATVCRLLESMEADERIVVVTVGRQNVVCLPDHDSDASFS